MRKYLYPLFLNIAKRPVARRLRLLKQWQWLDHDQTEALQKKHLSALLRHVQQHVPYYHERLAPLVVDGKVDLTRFHEIPLMSKTLLQVHAEELRSDDLEQRRWHISSSGGSTGEPVPFVVDADSEAWGVASRILFNQWMGYSPGAPLIQIWGHHQGHTRLRHRLGRWINGEVSYNTIYLSSEKLHAIVRKINTMCPNQITGFPESIFELARFIEEQQLSIQHSPTSILTTGGTLYPLMEETIERVFGSPIFNRYGSREAGNVACDCERHAGLHVCQPTHYVEILRDDGTPAPPGEPGEIVVTCFFNYAMPFIRYRIGDVGVWAEQLCTCGRSWPMIQEIVGRTNDFFVRPDGALVYPTVLSRFLRRDMSIRRYQVIQKERDYVQVKVVPTRTEADFLETWRQEVIDKVRQELGENCKVELLYVDHIEPTPLGKHRYLISEVNATEDRLQLGNKRS